MIQKRVLVVAMYPVVKPMHGGQKRAKAIYEFYKANCLDAKFVGIFHRGQYPDWSEDDMPLGQLELIRRIDAQPYASELIAGEAPDKDIHVRSALAKLLKEYKPDVIHLEQPYSYIGLRPLLRELNLRPNIIFGSQDTEYILKERVFKNLDVPSDISQKLVEKTKKLEYQLSQEADAVVAVSPGYARVHEQMGASKCIVVPNGIDKTSASRKAITYWQALMEKKKVKRAIVFVGSGHSPNWEGFLSLIGTDTKFIPEDSKLFIAGGVSDYFMNEFKDKKKYSNFWAGIELVGKLEEDTLAGLLGVSTLIVLPVTSKQGSNLKTAEAILSRKKVVTTSNALNGFRQYRALPNIYVADTQKSFKESISTALEAQYKKPSPEEKELSSQVQWKYCLSPLLQVLDNLPQPGYQTKVKMKYVAAKRTAQAKATRLARKIIPRR